MHRTARHTAGILTPRNNRFGTASDRGISGGEQERTMGKQAIKLKILGKPYSFNIDSEKEELYRLAEREVNNNLVSIRQKNIQGWSEVDYLGMTALKFAIENVDMRQNRDVKSDELKTLEALEAEIDDYLHKI